MDQYCDGQILDIQHLTLDLYGQREAKTRDTAAFIEKVNLAVGRFHGARVHYLQNIDNRGGVLITAIISKK